MIYTVGEMAQKLGVPASTLRYYDKEGLLPFVERSSGGIRMFRETDFEWLQVIRCMKKAGMSIKDIRQYIELSMQGERRTQYQPYTLRMHSQPFLFLWFWILQNPACSRYVLPFTMQCFLPDAPTAPGDRPAIPRAASSAHGEQDVQNAADTGRDILRPFSGRKKY